MIIIASLFCDRKKSSWEVGLNNIFAQDFPQDWMYYMNIESSPTLDITMNEKLSDYDRLMETAARSGRPFAFDVWTNVSSWWRAPSYDQDQTRLSPIVKARNMCLEFARQSRAYGILFVDADVIIPVDALSKLERTGKQIIGGVVPGRGVHKNVKYIYGETGNWEGRLQQCSHGTLGCMFIRNEIFDFLSFRWGKGIKSDAMLSEDPAYCNDADVLFGQKFWIHHDVVCEHWDDPEHPLTYNQVAGF